MQQGGPRGNRLQFGPHLSEYWACRTIPCNSWGRPGNVVTTAETMKMLEGEPCAHGPHLQEVSLCSAATTGTYRRSALVHIADYFNARI